MCYNEFFHYFYVNAPPSPHYERKINLKNQKKSLFKGFYTLLEYFYLKVICSIFYREKQPN